MPQSSIRSSTSTLGLDLRGFGRPGSTSGSSAGSTSQRSSVMVTTCKEENEEDDDGEGSLNASLAGLAIAMMEHNMIMRDNIERLEKIFSHFKMSTQQSQHHQQQR
ncbi:hypothetical protein CC2G_002751 [Coprinopsis cinerea AmutBmut pab1-1]|nr:hypothetical protein CC2G_002751 [Coprinopsis cinerea AmutBmut pab1-1]